MTGADDRVSITAADIRWELAPAPPDTGEPIDLPPYREFDDPTAAALEMQVHVERQLLQRIRDLEASREAWRLIARQAFQYAEARNRTTQQLTADLEKARREGRWQQAQNRALRAQLRRQDAA